MLPTRLAILGPGLLGGSLALAAAARIPGIDIRIWARRESALDEIRTRHLARLASTDPAEVVRDADLVILCVPIGAMPDLSEIIAPHLRSRTLVTDVGSVKADIVTRLAAIFEGRARFVGSHPMAGSEQAGLAAARADLFENATCILTPHDEPSRASAGEVAAFYTALGGIPRELSPAAHDEIVGLISHLPHLAAAALVNLVCERHGEALNFCGNGFRDTTRIASGPAAMWSEILRENSPALRRSLHGLIDHLHTALDLLDQPDALTTYLDTARAHRDRLTARH